MSLDFVSTVVFFCWNEFRLLKDGGNGGTLINHWIEANHGILVEQCSSDRCGQFFWGKGGLARNMSMPSRNGFIWGYKPSWFSPQGGHGDFHSWTSWTVWTKMDLSTTEKNTGNYDLKQQGLSGFHLENMAIWTPSCHETWLATGHCHFWG